MDPIDNALTRALSPNDRDETEALRQAIADTFQRRTRWLSVITWFKMFLFVIAAVICAWFFFRATTTQGQIALAAGFIIFALGNIMMFMFYWMEVNRAWMGRELKRIELQVARLAARAP